MMILLICNCLMQYTTLLLDAWMQVVMPRNFVEEQCWILCYSKMYCQPVVPFIKYGLFSQLFSLVVGDITVVKIWCNLSASLLCFLDTFSLHYRFNEKFDNFFPCLSGYFCNYCYSLNNHTLKQTDSHPYLGVTLDKTLSWSQHYTALLQVNCS